MKSSLLPAAISGMLVLLLTACNKEEPESSQNDTGFCTKTITVTGIVRDSLTGELITGGIVQGRQYPAFGVSEYTLDSTGHYMVTAEWNPCSPHAPESKPSGLFVVLRKDANYHCGSAVDFQNVPDNSTVNRDVQALPYSYINVHVTGDAGANHLTLLELIGPFNDTKHFDVGTGLIDTTIVLKAYSNRTSEIKLIQFWTYISSTYVHCGYGTTENIEIHYP